ncbi:response regulator transcription factor [Cohnella lupini]|uniref:Two-component system response regulator YesN n=1 Tax=Cohnella lupini TaxID=1294267 RepID=A0A3D9IAA3_9BACL|nr:response regulator [Cohnella lupini]RED58126.1 two-component system response regulator YesN [Cohnella lupini]
MYNVLIVDDEEPLREAIRILGDWTGLGVGKVLEATDGQMCLTVLAENKVDVVIVDMKMPVLNGVELLRILERDHPDLLTIVISGYNDFEYTRQAIHSKVVDYLLKPVNRADLNQALDKAFNLIAAKRLVDNDFINKNITLNMSLPKLKEKIYLSIIERSTKNQLSEAMMPLIGADDKENRFAVIVLRILNLEEIGRRRFHDDVDLLHFAVANVINEIAGDHFHCFSFPNPRRERELITVVTMKGGYKEDMAYRSIHQMNKVASTLNMLFGALILVGIGDIRNEVMGISGSYESAKAAIKGIDLLKLHGSVVVDGSEKSLNADNHSWVGRIPMIRSALESGNLQHARSIISDYSKKWGSSESFRIGEADRTLHDFVTLMNDMAMDLKANPERLPLTGENALREIGILTDYTTFGQYEELFLRLLDYYGEEIRRSQTANRPFEVGDIKAYIDDYYYEDIKISMFTEKYYLSREYLMRLFKQQFGFGIHEYVQKVRMDKAKVLLDDPALKIQDISSMLGFKDKNYFSKAFRTYYSVSPSEYRENPKNG